MKAFVVSAAVALLILSGTAQGRVPVTVELSLDSLEFNQMENRAVYSSFQPVVIGRSLQLACRTFFIELKPHESAGLLQYYQTGREPLGWIAPSDIGTDRVTSDGDLYGDITSPAVDRSLGRWAIYIDGEIEHDGSRFVRLSVFPVTIDPDGTLYYSGSVTIYIDNRHIDSDDMLENLPPTQSLTAFKGSTGSALSTSGPEYIIVTSRSLAGPLEELAQYKTSVGIQAKVAFIEDILSRQSGRDDAERLREYLKIFHADGGRYVLLAGDETIIPVRYAHHNSTEIQPVLAAQQICDLYFADLTGAWDIDGDNVWGEVVVDGADLQPELLVGRLPFNRLDETANYVAKLIEYETNPGRGESDYLNRAMFFSSDEMRDYTDGGQHYRIAQAYPTSFDIDTINGVEASSGDDPLPHNLSASGVMPVLSEGYGIINIIAHGRTDGFGVRTSGYNNWPKSYFLSETGEADHGSCDSLLPNQKTSFYYSLACDNGGFDMDQPPFNQSNPNLVQKLLGLDGAGAVAFVAYSRWGWISTSHFLQKTFFDSLFAHPDRPAIEAMNASKAVYYYYRDLNYGQNFFGDPSLKIYTEVPHTLKVDASTDSGTVRVTITSQGNPVAGCEVIISQPGMILSRETTDGNGRAQLPFESLSGETITLAAVKTGYTISRDILAAGLASGNDGSDGALPTRPTLMQNYPNPFNPTTTIAFDLPQSERVEISIYNILGREVTTLIDEYYEAGYHELNWDGRDRSGHDTASGIYFYRLRTESHQAQKKMLLIR